MYKIAEKFLSINGEGPKVGELSAFIRFAGCNLSCIYCDTQWANEENDSFESLSDIEIYNFVKSTKSKNVTLTGGEPLFQKNILNLLKTLCQDSSLSVEIETNGSVNLKPFLNISENQPRFTIDYKTLSSGMEHRMLDENYSYLKPSDTVKFVVGDDSELITAKNIITKYNLDKKCNIHFSPIFKKVQLKTIAEFIIDNNLNTVALRPQIHKFIWHPDSRGV
jgi:7-carboxy-7-deazaguanine synthase